MADPGPVSDPWHWSVDEVVNALCRSRNLWRSQSSFVLPDPALLENSLRENDINGSTLLSEVDKDFLRNDCGITSLGQRTAILWAVNELRDQSTHYLAEQRRSATRQQSVLQSASLTPIAGFKREWQSTVSEAPLSTAQHLPHTPPYHETPREPPDVGPVGSKARPDEVLVEDDTGRKRRKLNLTAGPQPQDDPAQAASTALPAFAPHDFAAFMGKQQVGNGYLGPQMSIDSVFFGETKPGQELRIDRDAIAPQERFEPGDFALSFVSSPRRALGAHAFVANRMRHFLGRATREVVAREPLDALMVKPYPEAIKATKGRAAAILYEQKGDRIVSTRTDAVHASQNLQHDDTESSENQWDFLLHWQEKQGSNEDVAELGSVRSSQISERFANELDEESEENDALSTDVVSATIDETLDSYAAAWNAIEDHKSETRAWQIWRKDGNRLSRPQRIDIARGRIQRYNDRLRSHKASLLRDTYRTAQEVQRCCANSKLTVEMREQERFKVDVLRRSQPPPRPTRRISRAKPRPSVAEDGGINIDSESEDGLSDFVDNDELFDAAAGWVANDLEDDAGLDGREVTDNMHLDRSFEKEKEDNENSITSAESDLRSGSSSTTDTVQAGGHVSALVDNVDLADVQRWSVAAIEEENQRGKLLIKILLGMTADDYQSLRMRIIATDSTSLGALLDRALDAVVKNYDFIDGVADEAEADTAFKIARLFAAWHVCRHEHWLTLDQETATFLLSRAASSNGGHIESFYTLLGAIFERFPKPLALGEDLLAFDAVDEDPVEGELLDDDSSDSADEPETQPPPSASRKAVQFDKTALAKRQKARRREQQSQAATQRLFQSLSQDVLADDESRSVLVNVEEEDEALQVFIHPQIARKMQQHQIEGVRFLWREVITGATSERDGGEGCLLAHTMGLGKTMQTITFLVTLAETVRNSSAVDLIPVNLRRLRTLILCPAALINNWVEEFSKWVPKDVWKILATIYTIDSTITPRVRLQNARTWAAQGGIMLVGYPLFQRMVDLDLKPMTGLTPQDARELARILLNEPRLIVADEAHKMKNLNSKLFKAAIRFKSQSRIALTGSPLANSLIEYFAMIDWVSPGYLGSAEEFRDSYTKPIEAGLYADSPRYNHRRALKKLKHLLQEIHPKVNRASIGVLRGHLQPKVEFVLKLQLTPLQHKLYTTVVRGLQGLSEETPLARIWSWMNLLLLINNHPSAFLSKLNEKPSQKVAVPYGAGQPKKRGRPRKEDVISDDLAADELPLESSGLSREAIQQLKVMLKAELKHHDPRLSVKAELFLQILSDSRAAGDRMLVFSQSLLTLTYLEELLTARGIRYLRLDGKVHTTKRQAMAKKFNTEDYSVFLISTKAGGTGFNLPGANRVVIFDFGFNPTHEEQAVGRAYRLGQPKPVFVYHFVIGGTFENTIHEKAIFKSQLAYRTLERKNISRKAFKTSEFLFEPREIPAEPLDEHVGKDHAVLDNILNKASAPRAAGSFCIRSITTAETLQQEAEDEKLTPEEEQEVAMEVERERLRREKPLEYERLYRSAPQPLIPNAVAVQSFHQQVVPKMQQPPLQSQDRESKITTVAQRAHCHDRNLVHAALAHSAWQVPDAIRYLSSSLNGPVRYGPGDTAAVPHNSSSPSLGVLPAARPIFEQPQVPTTNLAGRSHALQSPFETASAAPAIQTPSEHPPEHQNTTGPRVLSAPRSEEPESTTPKHSPRLPHTPVERSMHDRQPKTEPSHFSRGFLASSRLPPDSAPAPNTRKPGRLPLSTAPSAKANGLVDIIDLVTDEEDQPSGEPPVQSSEPSPAKKSRRLKRFNVSVGAQRGDGAFDNRPTMPKGPAPSIFQSDGITEVALQKQEEKSPPISSQGFVRPRELPPRLWGAESNSD